MLKKLSTVPFSGTAEQQERLQAVIDANKHDKSLLMAVMQQAQDIYEYLPIEVQAMIAEGMDVPLEKVYGVATFYALRLTATVVSDTEKVCLFADREQRQMQEPEKVLQRQSQTRRSNKGERI